MSAEQGTKSQTTVWMVSTLGALALYFLSIGPVIYFEEKGMLSREPPAWVEVIYWPLYWIQQNTPLEQPLGRYVSWWVELAQGPSF